VCIIIFKDELSLRIKLSDLIEVLDDMYDGFLLSTIEGRVFYANKAVEEISGITLNHIVNKTPNEMEKAGHIIEQTTFVGAEKSITMIHKLQTGREIFITSKPIYDNNGVIICFVANYRNLSSLEAAKKYHEISIERQVRTDRVTDINHENWIGDSPETVNLKTKVAKVAKTEAIVLILGESGVGKEVVANNLHKLSNRNNGPYVQINCAAIPEDLIEAELFGYKRGAFTGAVSDKKGLLESADGGTILLDEIGEMPLILQAKLLRTIQTQTITRVGGTNKIKLDIRFIAATNRNLRDEVEKGNFREDLFYRLNVIPIHIQPLNKRKEDIIPLIMFFLDKFNKKYKTFKSFSPEALQVLFDYYWPGNVRQLENVVERLVIMTEKNVISPLDLPSDFEIKTHVKIDNIKPLKTVREEAESRMIQIALNKYGTIRQAAKHLKVSHSTIVRKVKEYQINYIDGS